MRGIDISTYQRGLDLSKIDFDFAIIKATEGTKLVQDTCDYWVQQCIQLGKRWGFYHFCAGGDPIAEADFFVDNTKNYFGHGIPVLDYEAYGRFGTAKAKQFLDRVYERTGVRCMVYMSRSVTKAEDWSAIARNHPLWVAQYANDEIVNGHQSNPWIQDGGFGPWASPIIHQYTSHGRLNGWSGNLDLDKAYITAEEWDALAAGDKAQDKPATEDKPRPSTPSSTSYKAQVTAKDGLNCRKSPSTSAAIVKAYRYGETLTITKEQSGWGYTGEGWVSLAYVSKSGTSVTTTRKVQVTAKEGLNCRKSPSTSAAIVKAYRYGETLTITKEQSGWGYTGEGWVSLAYVK